ncbi:MAG: hypothetical protein L6Q71_05510, partial [Planctomycetes bacterium]|nr:hypothetical protein [Planctomycetota bacterium]
MDRLELIENRLHTSLARNGEGANWPRRAIWIVTWASVTGALLGLLAFPFKHNSVAAMGGL